MQDKNRIAETKNNGNEKAIDNFVERLAEILLMQLELKSSEQKSEIPEETRP